jgi:epoxide hydrolase-like predicted phosphatase
MTADTGSARLRGLIVDYGGVLTSSLGDAMASWMADDDIDPAEFETVMRDWLGDDAGDQAARNPVHALETGAISTPDFERELASRLTTRSGSPPPAEGLLTRMFRAFRQETAMVTAVRAAHRQGVATALLSNSWGLDYPREGWDQLFDATVISGEVGLRKPDPRIYRLAAERLALRPEQCVFVDDLRPNVRAAVAVGMVAVHHTDAATTVAELEAVLGISLMSPG